MRLMLTSFYRLASVKKLLHSQTDNKIRANSSELCFGIFAQCALWAQCSVSVSFRILVCWEVQRQIRQQPE